MGRRGLALAIGLALLAAVALLVFRELSREAQNRAMSRSPSNAAAPGRRLDAGAPESVNAGPSKPGADGEEWSPDDPPAKAARRLALCA